MELPAIYTIQATDAPQHTVRLQELLQNLKEENRIRTFKTVGVEDDLSSITNEANEDDLILIVLTQRLESYKGDIEDRLKEIKASRSGIRIGEIIVDNVPYENEFITFPADLRPIRDRENMDAVWATIDESLKKMFPAKEKNELNSAIDWPKYLKIGGVVVCVLLAFFIIRWFWAEDEVRPAREVTGEAVQQEVAEPAEVRRRLEELREVIEGGQLDGKVPRQTIDDVLRELETGQIEALIADDSKRRQFELKLETLQQNLAERESVIAVPEIMEQETESSPETVLQTIESARRAMIHTPD